MAELIEVEIPVKKHLKKFLCCRYSHHHHLSLTNSVGNLIFYMMRNPRVVKQHDQWMAHYPEKYMVKIPSYHLMEFKRIDTNITSLAVVSFNDSVKEIFEAEMFNYIHLMTEFGKEQQQAIDSFMQKYGILETDITADALKKSFYRFRKEQDSFLLKSLSSEN